MPSGKHNVIRVLNVITDRLDVFTVQHHFSLTGAFWHTAVRTVHALWTYLCPPSIFADSARYRFVVDGFHMFVMGIVPDFRCSCSVLHS